MSGRRGTRRSRAQGAKSYPALVFKGYACPTELLLLQIRSSWGVLGCPWKTVRPKYERVFDSLKKSSPLSFVIVGRRDGQNAEDLLKLIEERLLSSSLAIFDASGGNANVSLEYGLAHSANIPRTIYISRHGASRRDSKDSPIIADLAGKRRNEYTVEGKLRALLQEASNTHNYTIRFERFLRKEFRRASKGQKRRSRTLALKVIHSLDGQETMRRDDVVERLQVDYQEAEVDEMIRRLHKAGLILSEPGRYSRVSIK